MKYMYLNPAKIKEASSFEVFAYNFPNNKITLNPINQLNLH